MPELGKATYTLVLNSAQFDAGMARSEARAAAATNGIAASVGKADAAVNSLGPTSTRTAAQVSSASGQMAMSFEEAGAAAVHAGAEAQAGAGQIVAAAGEAAGAVEASSARQVSAWNRAGKSMMSTGKKMRSVGRGMTHKLTLPAALITGVGIKMALDYQEQLSLIGAQAGASSEEVEMLTDEIKEMAASGEVIHSANALAKAMFNIESSGFRGAKALEVLRAASDLSMVGNSELEASTHAIAGAMKTRIRGTETATKAAGLLNSIVGAGMMRMPELVESLGTGILDPAAAMGLGLQDVGAAMAVFTSRGAPAVQTATRLRMALNMMAAPTPKAKAAFKEIGIGQGDLANIMRGPGGLPAALDYLVEKLNKIEDPVKRYQLVSEAFGGAKSGATMIGLIRSLDDLHVKYDQIARDADKIKQTILEEQQEPINKLRIAWAQLGTALIDLGNTAIPVVVALALAVVKVIQAFQKLPGPVKAVVIGLGLLLAVIGPILSMIGFMTIGIGGLILGVSKLTISLGGLRLAMIAVATNPLTAVFVAAAAAAMVLYQAIQSVNGAMSQMEAAQERTLSTRSVATDLFNLQYKRNIAKGMTPAAARAAATKDAAAYAKRMGATGKPFQWKTQAEREAEGIAPKVAPIKIPKIDIDTSGLGLDKVPKGTGTGTPAELLPLSMRMAMTKAERTKTLRDDLKVASEEEAFYRKLLRNRKLRGEKRLEIERALTDVMGRITTLIEQGARSGTVKLMMPRFKQRLTKAKQTETIRDDLKVWNDEKAYLQKLLKNKGLEAFQRKEIHAAIERANKKIEALQKKKAEEQERHFKRLKELQAVMDLRGSFFSEFAGNIFGQSAGGLTLNVAGQRGGDKNLTVNQSNSYSEIPANRHGHARAMQKAASATMESM